VKTIKNGVLQRHYEGMICHAPRENTISRNLFLK
jgi:hypothetical protein